jgi:hypothetical protein
MKLRFGKITSRYAAVAFFAGVLFGASAASAAPLRVISGRVCDLGPVGLRAPEVGEVRCSASSRAAGLVKVTALSRKGTRVFETRSRPTSGIFRLRLRAGDYTLRFENGGYQLSVSVRNKDIKNVDLIRGIYVLNEGSHE